MCHCYHILFGYSIAGICVSFDMRHFYECSLDYRYIALDMCSIYHYSIARYERYLKTCIILFVYVLCTTILFSFLGWRNKVYCRDRIPIFRQHGSELHRTLNLYGSIAREQLPTDMDYLLLGVLVGLVYCNPIFYSSYQ